MGALYGCSNMILKKNLAGLTIEKIPEEAVFAAVDGRAAMRARVSAAKSSAKAISSGVVGVCPTSWPSWNASKLAAKTRYLRRFKRHARCEKHEMSIAQCVA